MTLTLLNVLRDLLCSPHHLSAKRLCAYYCSTFQLHYVSSLIFGPCPDNDNARTWSQSKTWYVFALQEYNLCLCKSFILLGYAIFYAYMPNWGLPEFAHFAVYSGRWIASIVLWVIIVSLGYYYIKVEYKSLHWGISRSRLDNQAVLLYIQFKLFLRIANNPSRSQLANDADGKTMEITNKMHYID